MTTQIQKFKSIQKPNSSAVVEIEGYGIAEQTIVAEKLFYAGAISHKCRISIGVCALSNDLLNKAINELNLFPIWFDDKYSKL
jgi:hypothetical protein